MFCANWKMNKTVEEGKKFIEDLVEKIGNNYSVRDKEIIIFPNFCIIGGLSNLIKTKHYDYRYNIKLGAQNFFPARQGAYTGETSIEILQSVGVEYFLIGHSERRNILAETQEFIDKKVIFAMQNNVKTIYCFGENLEERKSGSFEEIIRKQLSIVNNINIIDNLFLAYEPIWAIGTGIRASVVDIIRIIELVRNITKNKVMNLLYGGSVDDCNIEELATIDGLLGYLVGTASLNAKKFTAIIFKG